MHEARHVEQAEFCPDREIYKRDRRPAVRAASAGGRSQVHHDGNEAANLYDGSRFWWKQRKGDHANHICNEYHAGYQESYVEGEGELHVQGYEGGTHDDVLGLPGRAVLMRPVSLFYLSIGVSIESKFACQFARGRRRGLILFGLKHNDCRRAHQVSAG